MNRAVYDNTGDEEKCVKLCISNFFKRSLCACVFVCLCVCVKTVNLRTVHMNVSKGRHLTREIPFFLAWRSYMERRDFIRQIVIVWIIQLMLKKIDSKEQYHSPTSISFFYRASRKTLQAWAKAEIRWAFQGFSVENVSAKTKNMNKWRLFC